MNFIYIPIGISASGKSFLYTMLQREHKACFNSELELVCPDDIRKELGDISDQSKNEYVFKKAHEQTNDFLKNKKDIFFSATNLSYKSRKAFYDIQKNIPCKLIFIIMKDSFNKELCKKRVKEDLENGKERSNTLFVVDKEKNIDVIDKQYKDFIQQFVEYDLDGKKEIALIGNAIDEFSTDKIFERAITSYDGTEESSKKIIILSSLIK